ncbi:MAG: alpha/beta fold hydrolase [Pseudomonadota bacterium]
MWIAKNSVLTAKLALLSSFLLVVKSAYGSSFPPVTEPFEAHRDTVRKHLLDTSMPQRTAVDIELNLPFEIAASKTRPYRGKFLLIHGLNDSPYVWHDVANEIAERGWDVRALLLPGHGSSPVNMLEVSYKQWLAVARAHFKQWDTDEMPIYVGGFSLGGVLATILALENPHIAGLFLVSPAYKSKLNNYLRWAWIYAKFRPWIFGGMIIEDNPIKYNSIPVNSGAQFFNTARYLRWKWLGKTLSMPTLMVVSENDSVVNIEYVRKRFARKFNSDRKKLLVYSPNPGQVERADEIVRNSRHPERRLLNQSHLSLINSPKNALFGETREILVCNGNEYPIFMACMRARDHWYGAQHTPSPDGVPVARTTYNPDFDYVMRSFNAIFDVQQQ